ncbi:MAG: DUF3866 family protein [Bacillota bacterium]
MYGAELTTKRVTRVERGWPGVVLVTVEGRSAPAVAYLDVVGRIRPGDLVVLNTTAVDLGLGTGGFDFVVAALDAQDPGGAGGEAGPSGDVPSPGHMMKWRYSPSQVACLTVEDPEHPGAEEVRDFAGLAGIPVVAAELHSQVPVVAAGLRAAWDDGGDGDRDRDGRPPRVVYVMTDAGALAARFSRLIPAMKEAGLVDAVVTAGQAFGGDVEAVTLHSALAAARAHLGADAVIVAMGPGEAGTGTRLGFSGLAQGEALNAAWALGGTPVAAARMSWADPRPRHRGLSHHTLTVLRVGALAPSTLVLPELPEPMASEVRRQLEGLPSRHRTVVACGRPALDYLDRSGLEVTTMGRGPDADPPFFLAAGAAGVHAARVASPTVQPRPPMPQPRSAVAPPAPSAETQTARASAKVGPAPPRLD